jgi:hypothetical protein
MKSEATSPSQAKLYFATYLEHGVLGGKLRELFERAFRSDYDSKSKNNKYIIVSSKFAASACPFIF